MATTLRQALKQAEIDLADLERRVDAQRGVVAGLRAAAELYSSNGTATEHAPRGDRMARTDAILQILGEHPDRGFTTSDLVPLVGSRRGTQEIGRNINAALAYLKGQTRAHNVAGHGWMLVDAPHPDAPANEGIDPDDIPF